MAAVVEIRNGDSIEFCTGLPANRESIESPLFSVLGNDWNFRFVYDGDRNHDSYYVFLDLKNARTKRMSYEYDYNIGIENKKNFVFKTGTRTSASNALRISGSELRRHLPSDYRIGNIIKFSFCFHLPSDPLFTVQLKSRVNCVQTRSYTDTPDGSLSKDFSALLDSGLYHDVEIKCKNHSIKAHKIVLSARSAVFKAMLQSRMLEARSGIVTIQEIDFNCIQDFVKYLYTDTLPELTFDKAMALYKVGDKYAVRSLTVRCSEYLQEIISQENAFQCFAMADTHSDKKLKDRVIAYILEGKLFLQDEFWSPFCERYPKIALDIYKLSHKNNQGC